MAVSLASDNTTLQYSIDGVVIAPLILRAAAGDWVTVNLTNNLNSKQVETLKTTWSAAAKNKNINASSNATKPYHASAQVGIVPRLVTYDAANNSGHNVGLNGTVEQKFQTVAPGGKVLHTS